mgnify:FL=1
MSDTAPEKPPFGAPCNGCGVCCIAELCQIGRKAFGDIPGPCPALQFHQGRFWCGVVLAEYEGRRQGVIELPLLEQTLAIGRGCDAEG